MKHGVKILFTLVLIFLVSILSNSYGAYGKSGRCLVIIEAEKGQWKAYDNLAYFSTDRNVMIKAHDTAMALGLTYENQKKQLIMTNGKQKNTYQKNSTAFLNKNLHKPAYVISSRSLSPLASLHYRTTMEGYEKLGFSVVLFYSTLGPVATTPGMDAIDFSNTSISHKELEKAIDANLSDPSLFPVDGLTRKQQKQQFYSKTISHSLFQRIYGKSYKENCTVPAKELRYIHLLHYGFDGKVHQGELIVNKKIAKAVLEIFYELYMAKYPIEKIVLIDNYNAQDEPSMEDNNTSAFNFRKIAGSSSLSKHSLGMAIDINPLYNPYVKSQNGSLICQPEAGREYASRKKDFPYKIDENDLCYQLFTDHGFVWGGHWSSLKDYQHFEFLY